MFGSGERLRLGYDNPAQQDGIRDKDTLKAAKIAVCKWAGTILDQHYPGHPWKAECMMAKGTSLFVGGVLKISLMGITPPKQGYLINLSDLQGDGSAKPVIRAGGELLERYGIMRGKFSADDWRQALSGASLAKLSTGRGFAEPLND